MHFSDHFQEQLEKFLNSIRPFERSQSNVSLSYVAFREQDKFELYKGRIIIGGDPVEYIGIRTDDFIAERHVLSTAEDFNLKCYLSEIGKGLLEATCGPISIPIDVRPTYIPALKEGMAIQQRWNALSLKMSPRQIKKETYDSISWSLRSGVHPFDGIDEVMSELGLAGTDSDSLFEIISLASTVFDFSSNIKESVATLKIRLAFGLDTTKATLAYKIVDKGQIVKRGIIACNEIIWEKTEGYLLGFSNLTVPEAAVVQCFAQYDGHAQHCGWCGDNARLPNYRRNLYEVVDPTIGYLRNLIFEQGKSGNARLMENGISRLLWMLGFSPIHFGGTAASQNFVDIVATTPDDQIILIEYTTGPIKIDKLVNLADRRKTVESMFKSSGHAFLRLDAMLVTSKSESGLETMIGAAKQLNVIVATREDLEAALVSTATIPSPIVVLERLRSKMHLLTTGAGTKTV